MIGIVLVSHSQQVAEGIKELAMQMVGPDLKIIPAGGMEDGSIGTDAVKIKEAIEKADDGTGVVVLVDLGSAVMSATLAIELLEEENEKIIVKIADAPILEGAISACVQAFVGGTMEEVIEAAELAREVKKI